MRYKEEKKQVTQTVKKIVLTKEEHRKLIEILAKALDRNPIQLGKLYEIELRTNKGYGKYFDVEVEGDGDE